MTKKTEPKLVDKIEDNEMYTVRLEFRSIGEGSQVVPDISYSHKFTDEYDGDFPAAYLLSRDILMMLNVMTSMHALNTEVDTDELSPDELAVAAIEAANSEDQTKH